MCGEKTSKTQAECAIKGSPPHVRGKASGSDLATTSDRITPACAGQRSQRGTSVFGCEDHPRMCGEKVMLKTKYSRH